MAFLCVGFASGIDPGLLRSILVSYTGKYWNLHKDIRYKPHVVGTERVVS